MRPNSTGNRRTKRGFASSIINDEGFAVNEKKTRVSYKYQRQEVTGLIVNDNKVTIDRKYKKVCCKRYIIAKNMVHQII